MADAVEMMRVCRERWMKMVSTRRVKTTRTREISNEQHAANFFFLVSGAAGSSVKMLDGMEMEDARKGWMGNGGLLPRVGAV